MQRISRVNIPNLRKLDSKVTQQNQFGAIPLFLPSRDFLLYSPSATLIPPSPLALHTHVLNLVFVEIWNAVDDHPRQRSTKIDNLVHEKGHDASGQDIIADKGVPGSPETLKVVELNIVFGDFFELAPVGA